MPKEIIQPSQTLSGVEQQMLLIQDGEDAPDDVLDKILRLL